MHNLTEKQKTIIENLTHEFEMLNVSNGSNSSLLDIDGMFSQLDNDIIRRKEIQITNKIRLNQLEETAKQYERELAETLERANIYVWSKKTADYFTIYFGNRGEYQRKLCYETSQIEIGLKYKCVNFQSGLDEIIEYFEDIDLRLQFRHCHINDFKNLNHLCENETFKYMIKNIFYSANKPRLTDEG